MTALAYGLLAYALLGGIVAPLVGHLLRRAGRDLDGWSS